MNPNPLYSPAFLASACHPPIKRLTFASTQRDMVAIDKAAGPLPWFRPKLRSSGRLVAIRGEGSGLGQEDIFSPWQRPIAGAVFLRDAVAALAPHRPMLAIGSSIKMLGLR